MANLFQDDQGNYRARKRIPDELREDYGKLYGQRYEAKFSAPASIGQLEAQRRFHEWNNEVTGRFETIRRASRGEGIDLDYKNATALAGEWYRWFVAQHEKEPGEPDGYWVEALHELVDTMRHHYARLADGYVVIDGSPVDFKPEVWTADVHRDPDVRKEMRPIIADLGHTAQFLANRGITLTNKARDLFLDCVLLNAVPALVRLERYATGDYSPDDLPKTFPPFEQNRTATPTGPTRPTPNELFQAWVELRKPSRSTIANWGTVFKALTRQFQATLIIVDQAQLWIDGLITGDRSAFTVRNIWLKAAKTVYAWALRRRMVPSNPFADVVVEKHKRPQHRPKHLYDNEIATILKAASAITDTSIPEMAARRWVPWLLAYTGARPGEITQLRAQDVKQIDGIWCLELTPDAGTIKTGEARLVPIHPHLIEQGFLEFAKARSGPLFYRAKRKQQNTTDPLKQKWSPAFQVPHQLAAWVREIGINDPHLIRPNHAWRHTFKLKGDQGGVPEKALDYICGHAPATVGRAYGAPELKDLARVIGRFPRYDVESYATAPALQGVGNKVG